MLTESLCWQGVYMKSPRPPQGTLPAPPFSIFLAIFRRTEAPVEKNVADTLQSTGSPHFRRKRTAQHCGSHTRSASCTLLENGPSQGLRKVSTGSNFWQGVYRVSKVAAGVLHQRQPYFGRRACYALCKTEFEADVGEVSYTFIYTIYRLRL